MKSRILTYCLLIATFLCGSSVFSEEQSQPPANIINVVALENNLPFSFALPDGTPSGLYVEFWQLWSKTNNIPIKFTLVSLEKGLQLIKQKNSLHAGLFRNEEREEWADFSLPIHNVQTGIIYNRAINKAAQLNDLKNIKISTQHLSFQESYVQEHFTNAEHVSHNNFDEAISQLLNKNIQGIIAELPNAHAHIAKNGMSGVFVISDEVILSNNVSAMIAKGQPKLLAQINVGIENIPVDQIIALEKQWLPTLKPFFESSNATSILTPEEISWISQYKPFSLGIDPQWAPFEFYDKSGNFSGITADYIKHVEQQLNTSLIPKEGMTWGEALTELKLGNIDVMSAVFYSEERAKELNFTDPYFEISLVLVSKVNAYYAESLTSLNGKTLGVIKDYIYDELIQQDYPNINLVGVNSVEDGLRQVQAGKVDAFVDSIAAINYEINKSKINDIIITAFTPYKLELSMVVRKGLEPLIPILNKTFAAMSEKQHSTIANNWLSVHVQSGTSLTTIILWTFPIASVLLFIIVMFYRMNQRLKLEIKAGHIKDKKRIAAQKDLAAQKKAMDEHSLVSVTDTKGNITYANDKFCAVSGYSQAELIGENHRILSSNSQPKSYWRDMYRVVSKGGVWNDEICNKTKDGQLFWEDTTIVPYYNNDNKLGGYISIRTDISHQKDIISRLSEAKKQADVANESKNDFLANMSHEIRTPMNGVIGMTNLLLDTALNKEQKSFATTVKYSAESLLIIINDILDYSKIEAGMLDLESIEFDLGELLHELANSIAIQAHKKGLELICPANVMPKKSYIADPGRIKQILNNLIGNAIKFTENGEVSVFCNVLEQSDERTKLIFEIKDTGIGLNDEKQSNLFERFSQADSSTTRKFGGTGLGLTISKQLVEMMDGEIGVRSIEGEGSTFWFTINIKNAQDSIPQVALDNLKNQKILVVDDNSTNRILLEQLLIKWQAESTVVESGEIALEKLIEAAEQGTPYHIAILDMQTPHMDGIQLGTAIKSNNLLSSTRLVMLTSQGQRGDTEKMKSLGFNGYLNKPVDQSILYNTLLKIAGVSTEEKELTTSLSAHKVPQFKARVLVVEDNAINQKVAKGLLTKFGVEVDIAANGQEALDSLSNTLFDMVFMDCQMPVMDGYEATKLIRQKESKVLNNKVPIVAMTANSMQGDQDKCISVGMDDFISKPINPNKVQEALNRWLN
ncbi:MAG: transporter substrate-binding domain-containing protein [Thalassotalea sp.]|nr:transporter substrate-binding domain-containing protein [Thalassotalea sp.]